ncbi:MAG: serine/threonine-protein kinase [Gemmatimonadaceae bacterium]
MTTSVDADALRLRLNAAVGDTLEVGELLGIGGFAAVFRAFDPRLRRDVAIKVLDPALGVTADMEEQFLREARAVAAVEHRHIVPVYAAESRDGLLYLVMRMLPGRPLSDRISRVGAMSAEEAARIAHEVGEALAFAHERGVIHRDIKPDNIMLDASGNASVTDFGISLVTEGHGADATEGMSVGTPAYMSPEQALAEKVDGRSDVYALGIVLFEMLTGNVPFSGRSIHELMALHIAAPVPSLAALAPETPVRLIEIVERMLAKNPVDRPDANDVVRALAVVRTPDGLLSPSQVRRRRLRKRLTYTVVIAVTAVLAVTAVITLVVKAITDVSRSLGRGDAPLVDAIGPDIPDSIVAAARADGLLRPGDDPTHAFTPAHPEKGAGIFLTDSVLIQPLPRGVRRIPIADADMDLNFHKRIGGTEEVGVLVVRNEGVAPDTIFSGLSGVEFTRLRMLLTQVSRPRGQESKR